MIFSRTKLPGVYEIDVDRKSDERGFFARTWCQGEFAAHGLSSKLVQSSLSFNAYKGTLRGMHYQLAPFAECKLVRCTQGAIYDVVLDLRPDSPACRQWVAVELTSERRNMIYIPEGCAHGFLTLTDSSEVFYQMSNVYNADAARGFRWNDPAFSFSWPAPVTVISERDRTYLDFVS